jgi:hypothetical protein
MESQFLQGASGEPQAIVPGQEARIEMKKSPVKSSQGFFVFV